MDEHTQGEELGLATESSILSEQELREMEKPRGIDYPMPGEVPDKQDEEKHSQAMPESVEVIDEYGIKQ